ncbi:MAG: PP2C family protein-serine/threonine phosphatase, partial [Acidobacteriota bacterium]
EIVRNQRGERVDRTLRFRWRDQLFGDELPHGPQVYFAGDEIAGYRLWHDDPDAASQAPLFRRLQVSVQVGAVIPFILLLIVAVPFLRAYHDGQLGVRKGVQLAIAAMVAGAIWLVMCVPELSEGTNIGLLTRTQTAWLVGVFFFLFGFVGLAAMGAMAWSVGEFECRHRWPNKLASLDALIRGRWGNATVARSSLRGVAAGVLTAGLVMVAALAVQRFDGWPLTDGIFGNADYTSIPALAQFAWLFGSGVPIALMAVLVFPLWAERRLGTVAGLGVAILLSSFLQPMTLNLLPWSTDFVTWLLMGAVPVLLFRFGDALSGLLAYLTSAAVLKAQPLLWADQAWLEINGWLILLAVASPLIVSLRYLGTDREFVYHWDDVPPHVRRIAERERQRVELETARGIQSSILPELPPQLAGVELAHAYLPATEVGGDFYDVLALEDGRLAVAVGDVAGHGVSSGLVMSMAKSALAVQVTFEPDVPSVFRTLNRMVYQSARRRLLTTLCYALLDPTRRELVYASAGHLFPYRVTRDGHIEALMAGAYPLGVRDQLDIRVRTARLSEGDTIVFYSDGLIETRRDGGVLDDDGDGELYGFERFEATLRRFAGAPPTELLDGVLRDVVRFAAERPRDDDLTVLVLRLPSAA